MIGIDANTGKALSGMDHLRASIADILRTPIGTRVMLLNYGCRAFDLIDRPLNRDTIIELYSAVAEALDLWEPRFKLRSVKHYGSTAGSITLSLTGDYLIDGKTVTIEGIVL